MHMADALLSPAVGLTMCAVSTGAIAWAVKNVSKDELCEKKIPVLGVMGAFVFAAQMINFTIPATGSSGHIGGGILLAAMLGASPALLAMAVVLLIQCLFFADGGLLALGCNIFNMGVIPCLFMYTLLFKPLLKGVITAKRITVASVLAVVLGLQAGAFAVVLQTWASGISELPISTFALLMQPIHLAIGLAEGLITAAVLCFVYTMRPEIMEAALHGKALKPTLPLWRILVTLVIITVLIGGGLSLFASSYPDGLEWALEKAAIDLPQKPSVIQETTAFMPDYAFKHDEEAGTSVAGLVGGVITFALAAIIAVVITAIKRSRLLKKAPQNF